MLSTLLLAFLDVYLLKILKVKAEISFSLVTIFSLRKMLQLLLQRKLTKLKFALYLLVKRSMDTVRFVSAEIFHVVSLSQLVKQ